MAMISSNPASGPTAGKPRSNPDQLVVIYIHQEPDGRLVIEPGKCHWCSAGSAKVQTLFSMIIIVALGVRPSNDVTKKSCITVSELSGASLKTVPEFSRPPTLVVP